MRASSVTIVPSSRLAEQVQALLLPCNVMVQERSEAVTEVAAVDPRATLGAVGNPALEEVANHMATKLENVIGRV